MTRLLTTLACLALLPGAALAKSHHHARPHHKHKPARVHRTAAETGGPHVAGYVHPPGASGGAVAIEQADGSVDLAFIGEKTVVRCGPSAEGPFTACSFRNLIVGAPVADANHGPNERGYDVWTRIDLITDHPFTDPAPEPGDEPTPSPQPDPQPQPQPQPEQHPAPQPQAVVDSFSDGVLSLHRLNNTERPTGRVTGGTSIVCVYVKAGQVDHATTCGSDALTPGTQVAGYAISAVDGVPTFTRIYLLFDEGS